MNKETLRKLASDLAGAPYESGNKLKRGVTRIFADHLGITTQYASQILNGISPLTWQKEKYLKALKLTKENKLDS